MNFFIGVLSALVISLTVGFVGYEAQQGMVTIYNMATCENNLGNDPNHQYDFYASHSGIYGPQFEIQASCMGDQAMQSEADARGSTQNISLPHTNPPNVHWSYATNCPDIGFNNDTDFGTCASAFARCISAGGLASCDEIGGQGTILQQ